MTSIKSVFQIKSDFTKNVLVLMTGSTLTQAIPIAVSPILTRIYSPDDFGVLALFTAITAVFSSLITARYELAILLPDDDQEAENLTILSILIALTLSIALGLLFFFFNSQISSFLGDSRIGPWLYFAPVVIFLAGVFNSFKYYNIRKGEYKIIARSGTLQSICSASLQLGLGVVKPGYGNLILGNGLPFFVSSWVLIRQPLKYMRLISKMSIDTLKSLATKYIEFPKYSLGANIANILSQNLSTVFISSTFNVYFLGQYALVTRILSMPSTLLGASIGDVFTKKAIDEKNATGSCRVSFRKTYLILGAFTAIIFTPLYFIISPLFIFVFGPKWVIAGEFAQILMPLLAIRFWMSPLTMVFVIFSKQQRVALMWQILFLILTLLSFLITYLYKFSIEEFLKINTFAICLLYILQFFVLKKMADNE